MLKFKKGELSIDDLQQITDPKDWIEGLLIAQRDDTLEKYNALTDEQKQEINNCFDDGDADVFKNVGSANGWIGEADEEDFAETKDKVEKVIASFQ